MHLLASLVNLHVVRRSLGLLLLAVFAASLNFAQVAPVTHSKAKPSATPQATAAHATNDGDEADDPDAELQAVIAQAQADQQTNPPSSFAGAARPAPSVPTPQAAPPRVTTQQQTDGDTTLQFPNSDVKDVLRFYESLTGKKLVMDNFVSGKVNIFISKPSAARRSDQNHRDQFVAQRLFVSPGRGTTSSR